MSARFRIRAVLLVADLQNDFIHPQGAYGRAGLGVAEVAALPGRLAPLVAAMRAAGGWVVSTHFTLVPGRRWRAVHLAASKAAASVPRARATSHRGPGVTPMLDELGPADMSVEKVAYSAF